MSVQLQQGNRIDVGMKAIAGTGKAIAALRWEWQTLESQSHNVSYFTSWGWISSVLQTPGSNCYCLRAEQAGQVVGLAILGYQPPSIQNGFNRELWLNKLGQPRLDQVWIEYNDFLLLGGNESAVRSAMLQGLHAQSVRSWTRLHLDMTNGFNQAFWSNAPFSVRIKAQDVGYVKHLSNEPDRLLASLSKNTRRQLSRSRRLLQPVIAEFNVWRQPEDKLACFEAIARQHIAQWRDTQWGSGFDNPAFVTFHQALFSQPQVEITELKLISGERAFLYNFLYRNTLYFYLSCVPKLADNKIKVGLVLHWMAMEHYAERGVTDYDFLAGDARYKRSMSDEAYELRSLEVCRNTTLNKMTANLRGIKHNVARFLSSKAHTKRDSV